MGVVVGDMAETANEQDTRDSDAEVIAPDDNSGFGLGDVLEKAEIDDEVYLEFEVEGKQGTYGVRSKVANTSETEQDDGKMVIEYHLEARGAVVEALTPKLLTGTGYNNILDSVKIDWVSEDTPTAEIYDVVHVEVEKA